VLAIKRVAVIGASGKMGREIVKGLSQFDDVQIVGAIDVINMGKDIGELAGIGTLGVQVTDKLEQCLQVEKPQIVVDFTHKNAAKVNIPVILKNGISVVAGTTGLSKENMKEYDLLARQNKTSIFQAPNFSLGAVLMMKYAREAASYLSQVEIIEYHNDKKVDSPSGTSIATAEGIGNALSKVGVDNQFVDDSKCRGGEFNGTRIHSVRLKSLIAHQEVLLAGDGELLTIRHDSFSRSSFIPGILLAIRKVELWEGLKIGLEGILDL